MPQKENCCPSYRTNCSFFSLEKSTVIHFLHEAPHHSFSEYCPVRFSLFCVCDYSGDARQSSRNYRIKRFLKINQMSVWLGCVTVTLLLPLFAVFAEALVLSYVWTCHKASDWSSLTSSKRPVTLDWTSSLHLARCSRHRQHSGPVGSTTTAGRPALILIKPK